MGLQTTARGRNTTREPILSVMEKQYICEEFVDLVD